MKLNEKGEYLPYFGVSIVALSEGSKLLSTTHDFITQSKISKYWAPLPKKSYHCTILNIKSTCESKKESQEYLSWLHLSLPKLSQVSKYLRSEKRPMIAVIKEVYSQATTMGLRLELKDPQLAARIRKEGSKVLNLSDKGGYQFHLTLGYRFAPVLVDDYGELYGLFTKLQELLAGKVLVFTEPKLCSFVDMTNFIPF